MRIQNDGFFFGQLLDDEDHLVPALNGFIETVNSYSIANGRPDMEIPLRVQKGGTQQVLSDLHVYFEKYCHDSFFTREIQDVLLLVNIYIHRLETFADGRVSNAAHIEILPERTLYLPFEPSDYELFTPDWTWGGLYLTYGITGVPTINGFRNNSESRPQHCMSQGMLLAFFGDLQFTEREELQKWMLEKGMDPTDPRWAVGYLPMGILENPALPSGEEDRKKLLTDMGRYRKVTGFSMTGPKPTLQIAPTASAPPDVMTAKRKEILKPKEKVVLAPEHPSAEWPYDPEIFYHLDYVPYIDLGVTFDPSLMLQEAQKAINYFVNHRDYDQESKTTSGKWKALGLRALFGDWEKTQYHTSYTFEGEALYEQTPFAELCPETMRFLSTITDVNKCDRIRFMLLEPGASIKTHRDSSTRDVSLAVNISLNMPVGCTFWTDVNPDGTENDFTKHVPFSDNGSVILFNNAKYHKVVNNSDTPRIHIIFHGPTRFSDDYILNRARKQNKIETRKRLLQQLMHKKALQGESFEKTALLIKDWIASGLSSDMFGESVRLLIWKHAGSDTNTALRNSFEKISAAAVFPLAYEGVEEQSLDSRLLELSNLNVKAVIVVAAGTMLHDLNRFILESLLQIRELRSENAVLAGHIMDFPEAGKIPYLHEQFLILDIVKWKSLGSPALGPLFSAAPIDFPAHDRGADLHDNYTPKFLSPGKSRPARNGHANWGSLLMAEALGRGMKVINLSDGIRGTKEYSYPRDTRPEALSKIQAIIQQKLNFSRDEVFFFNNEALTVPYVEDLRPNKIISVSAGLKAFRIMDQYDFPVEGQLIYTDFSARALQYMRQITQQENISSLESTIDDLMAKWSPHKWEKNLAHHLLAHTIRDEFAGEHQRLEQRLRQARSAQFKEMDFVLNPDNMVDLLEPTDHFIIWVSNAFYNNHLYYLIGEAHAAKCYVILAQQIAKKMQLRAFREIGTRTIVFGKTLDQPVGLLTDGATRFISYKPSDWEEITGANAI